MKGANNPHWKGGSTKHQKGYIYTWGTDRGYVFAHVLVMEEKLGRRLFPNENVHHMNGVKDDNRPDNLELWTVNQPPGQRVEDLIAWAHEILDRYEG